MGSTVPALWTKHRGLARAIASGYYARGHEPQDLEQEALIALWVAAREYDPARGKFVAFARVVIERRLTDLVRRSNLPANRAFYEADRDTDRGQTVDYEEEANGQLRLVLSKLFLLTPLERTALATMLNGDPLQNKSYYNALDRARRKLAA
jgi:RNA polymerase sigma factor (sigma-70 family)